MNSDYYYKYIKYKKKYLDLKNNQSGGLVYNLLNYDQLLSFDCNKGICNYDNNKLSKIKTAKYTVTDINKKISLYDSKALYSQFDKDNYNVTFGYLKEMLNIIDRLIKHYRKNSVDKKFSILILGFGLGGSPLKLSLYDEFYKIDSIDIDGELFRMFKSITQSNNLNISNKLGFIEGDAIKYLEYMRSSGIKYDFILDDIFDSGEKVNYNFNTVYDCLEEDGVFFMNVHFNPSKYVDILKKDNYKDVSYVTNSEHLIYAKK